MRVAIGQFNPVVGDLEGNAEKMRRIYKKAMAEGIDLLVFGELAVAGYPPEDLLLKKHFLEDNLAIVEKLAADCPDTTIIAGLAGSDEGNRHNCAAVLRQGTVEGVYRKVLLPNYGVFDEARYFKPGKNPLIVEVKGLRVAVTICEDIWDIRWLTDFLKEAGPIELLVNISASPFHVGKTGQREQVISTCATQLGCAACYCNLVGGQDEIVFDGRSMFADSTGKITARAAAFEEDLLIAEVTPAGDGSVAAKPVGPAAAQPAGEIDEVYRALVLGTRDYAVKNSFAKVLIGLSGGIDSSVVAAVAAAALAPESVTGITMPSKFNSPETISDARKLAENLGIGFLSIPIEQVLDAFNRTLAAAPGWNDKTIAYENLQARIRGTILMSLSNQYGALVLTTGNKSETAVGYTTLYGDTAGGFAVIKDVPKTMVYKLAEHINRLAGKEVIPQAVITRPPSAELRPGQKDTDSLPNYDLLDKILQGYVEEDKSAQELIEAGLPKNQVLRVIRLVDRNEYKRRQSPPGVKITPKAFGKDRRLPITNRYGPRAQSGRNLSL